MTRLYRAALIVPVASPPIIGGCVEVAAGRIVAVHSKPLGRAIDLGPVALLPGLINAHTHLEFSHLNSPLTPTSPFTDWLSAVIRDRRENPVNRSETLAKGLKESFAAGAVAVGEIASRGWYNAITESAPAMQSLARGQVVAFHESLGLRRERLTEELILARQFLSNSWSPGFRPGLSPHAPYSVHPELVRELVKLAVQVRVPLSMHLAESPGELELLQSGSGEFVDFLSHLGVWDSQALPRGRKVVEILHDLSPAPRVLVVHGNFLDDDDCEFLATHPQFSVVYCPRTHAGFGHPPHPWRALMSRGVKVVLGTDSRASNPDLSIWNEARFLAHAFPDTPAESLLRMITLDAAQALGVDADLGAIQPGRRARLTAIPLPDERPTVEDLFRAAVVQPLNLEGA